MTWTADTDDAGAIASLLADTSTSFQQMGRILRLNETDSEAKAFFAFLTAYSTLIGDQVNQTMKLGRRFDTTVLNRTLQHFASALSSRHEGLHALNQGWGETNKATGGSPILFIQESLYFDMLPEGRNSFIQTLDSLESELEDHFSGEPGQWTAEDFAPQRKISEPAYGVCKSAKSAFDALAACTCSCEPKHDFGARLSLCTYRKTVPSPEIKEDIDFTMFLSMTHDWYEARVHASKDTVLQWADCPIRESNERRNQAKSASMKVRRLCEPIQKIETMLAHRLEFKVQRGKLFKLRSERSDLIYDRTKKVITLEHFLRAGARSFTEKSKRILFVLLAHAVLHLHDTPWLCPSWSSSDIFFFQTATSAVPLMPFIQTKLLKTKSSASTDPIPSAEDTYESQRHSDQSGDSSSDFDPDEIDPDDLVCHQCPSLVSLAVVLMEIHFETPFRTLAKRYEVILGDTGPDTIKYMDAELVFRACRKEIPENTQFRYAVEKCLNPVVWEDESATRLDDQSLRVKIYEEVVRPLETELITAYTYISIDQLDQLAQATNFTAWDQKIMEPQRHDQKAMDDSEANVRLIESLPMPTRLDHTVLRQSSPRVITSNAQQVFSDPGRSGAYKAFKFFDDESSSGVQLQGGHDRYQTWKSRYQEVYEKFISDPGLATTNSRVSPVKIAILDTGIDMSHPDVEAREENIKGKHNWLNAQFRARVHDRHGHGTFSSSLILDYAPEAELYIAKIAEDKPSSPQVIAQAINHAVEVWKVDIISMSFGFPTCDIEGYNELETAILNAYSNHVLLFAAASNNGGRQGRSYPARDPNVICIHSTDTNGNRSGFSPTAIPDDINFATVGEVVESSWPVHLCDDETNPCYVQHRSGTSYATPIAVGISAFLLQYARLHLPQRADNLKRQKRMKAVLKRIAEKGAAFKPRDGYYFIDISLYDDGIFGKGKGYVDMVIGDLLRT